MQKLESFIYYLISFWCCNNYLQYAIKTQKEPTENNLLTCRLFVLHDDICWHPFEMRISPFSILTVFWHPSDERAHFSKRLHFLFESTFVQV